MKLVLHVVTMVVCSIFRIDFSLTQEILCTLRSPIGDVIYNTSSDAQCGRDGNHTGVDFLTCPEEEQTFLSGSHCCIQDQLLLNGKFVVPETCMDCTWRLELSVMK